MKLGLKIAALLLMSAAFAVLTSAEPVSQLHASNYVNDFAGVLNEQTTAQLNDVCRLQSE